MVIDKNYLIDKGFSYGTNYLSHPKEYLLIDLWLFLSIFWLSIPVST